MARAIAAFLVAAAVLSPVLLLIPAPASAANGAGETVALALHGDALDGWGPTADNITKPGQRIVLFLGDTLSLTLIGNDSAPHNWFIDFDNDSQDDAVEPNSPDFQANTTFFNFTATATGVWTYRCRYHPNTMFGVIEVKVGGRPRSFILHGDTLDGWGPTPGNITNPGPLIFVNVGDNVTLTLIGNDSAPHNWFIDFDNDSLDDPEELDSEDFQANTTVFNFIVPDRPGNWTYRCRYHPSTMTGLIVIIGAGSGGPSGGIPIGLIPGIMIGTVIFALLFAAVYHVRAVRAHRRLK